jgi:hypothetical protein
LRDLAEEGWGECAQEGKEAHDQMASLAADGSLDAAIDLASQDDPVRRAFCEAALAAAGSWRDQNRADLELAFAV